MAREEAHERVCTFLVSSDKSQASGKEIREALESSNDEAKVDALQKAVAALLAGEQLPALFITIVRYVLPSENHQVQKLLLLYLETINKTDATGKLLPEMILICQNLRNNLQHPNEYIRGVTLRFLARIREEELLEPLIPSVMANLEHRHSYVRKNAVLALDAILRLPRGELLAPDASEVVERLLGSEQDLSTRRNAFNMLARHDRTRAVGHLFENIDRVADWGDVLQMSVLDLTRRVCGEEPGQKPRFIKIILALLQSRHTAVVYEAAVTLVALSSAPSAVRAAADTFCTLLAGVSDNNVKLIVLDRVEELAGKHPAVLRESVMGVLRALGTPDADVRRKALAIARTLVTERSVGEVVALLRREVVRAAAAATADASGGADARAAGDYRAALVETLHACAARFPAVAPQVLEVLVDFLAEPAALDVAYFVREMVQTQPGLHAAIIDRLVDVFPSIAASRVAAAVLWILAEYCEERRDIQRVIRLVQDCVGPLPLVKGGGSGGTAGPDATGDDATTELESNGASAATKARPAVLADGSYASQTAVPGATPTARAGGSALAATEGPALRAALLAGGGFLLGVLAASLTKLAVRLRATGALSDGAFNALAAELMLLLAAAMRAGEVAALAEDAAAGGNGGGENGVAAGAEVGGAAQALGPPTPTGTASAAATTGLGTWLDARDRAVDCLHVISDLASSDAAEAKTRATVWLEAPRAAFARLLEDRAAAEAAEARRDAARRELQPDDAIDWPHLRAAPDAPRAPGQAPLQDAVSADVERAATGTAGNAAAAPVPGAATSGAAAMSGAAAARLSRVVQLTGFSDPLYAEAFVSVHQYDIVLDVAVTNRTQDTLQNVTLELSTMGDLKLVERPASATLAPRESRRIRANIKVSSTETGAIFGNLVFEASGYGDRSVVALNDIHIDILDYIVPAACTDAAFRAMWAEFEWENKVAVSTSLTDEAAFLDHVIAATNMRCLTPAAARAGDAGFLAANLYARSVFGEDALVNVAVERGADGKLAGYVRIRSKTQGIALSLGDKLILKQKSSSPLPGGGAAAVTA